MSSPKAEPAHRLKQFNGQISYAVLTVPPGRYTEAPPVEAYEDARHYTKEEISEDEEERRIRLYNALPQVQFRQRIQVSPAHVPGAQRRQ